jgi:fused signal recognition particle receptor
MDTTRDIMAELTRRVKRRELNDTRALHGALSGLAEGPARTAGQAVRDPRRPAAVRDLFVGVNGAGKTTTIGKLAASLKARVTR